MAAAASSSSGSSPFLQFCSRRGLQWERCPEVQVCNGLLRSSASFAFYSHSADGLWLRLRFCSMHTDDLVELVRDDPTGFLSPWPYKDVVEAFLETERKQPSVAVSQYDLQEGGHLLLRVESTFMAMSWERKSPAPASWRPSSAGTQWQLYRGFTKQHRLLVCVLSRKDGDPVATFAIFLDIGARRAIHLPADLTDAAVLFATQYDPETYQEYGKPPAIVFTTVAENKVETFPPKPVSPPTTIAAESARHPTSFSFVGLTPPSIEAAPVDAKPHWREPAWLSHAEPASPQNASSQAAAAAARSRRRLCSWCLADTAESNVHLCGLCSTAVYCSRDCLQLDWNRGLHQAVCRAVDRADLHALPAALKLYRRMLGELGLQARQRVQRGHFPRQSG